MPINESASLVTQDALRSLAVMLDSSPHGKRGELMEDFSKQYGWSVQKIYNNLKGIGWNSGRKPRGDKGRTSQDMTVLKEMSALIKLGIRKNGKATMHTPTARSVLSANDRDFKVSNSRLNTLLKDNHMNLTAHKQDSPCQVQRSLHPNHVHLVDPSLCLLYYLPDGSQKIIRDDEAYKNKPETIEKIGKLKVWRYVLTDHFSHTIIVKYYQAKGETQANLFDFLLYCWSRGADRPFHGVPKILYWDKGSANTAKAIKNALRALDVVALEHEAGRARAKGSVEKANDMVECLFESRLKYEPVKGVEELNIAAEHWCNAYNSNSIPGYDSRLGRKLMGVPKARYALWQIIRQDQLRILPDIELCRYLLSADPEERKVKSDLSISFKHPGAKRTKYYSLRDLPGISHNKIVRVAPLIYRDLQVLVYVDDYRGEEQSFTVDPIEADTFSGFPIDAAIIGEEMKSPSDTCIEKESKSADQVAYPGLNHKEIDKAKNKNTAPFNGEINSHSHLADVQPPSYMRRPGSEISIPDRVNIQSKPLSIIEACKRLAATFGHLEGVSYHQIVSEQYPNGVPEEEFNDLAQLIRKPRSTLKLAK